MDVVQTAYLNKAELLLNEEQDLFAFIKLLWSVDAALARSQVCTFLGWAVISSISVHQRVCVLHCRVF
jgi:hypothetical protein